MKITDVRTVLPTTAELAGFKEIRMTEKSVSVRRRHRTTLLMRPPST
jgi:hypothetical protein